MTFNEANTVEAFIRDQLAGGNGSANVTIGLARQGGAISGLGWHFVGQANLPRQSQEALVEPYLRDALIRLNPDIAANPSRVDDVLYRLRAIVMSARSDGLVKANEEFAAWMLGERSMPFGADGQHVTIRLIDFDDIEQNSFVVTQQFTFRAGKTEKRADLMLLVNGLPPRDKRTARRMRRPPHLQRRRHQWQRTPGSIHAFEKTSSGHRGP